LGVAITTRRNMHKSRTAFFVCLGVLALATCGCAAKVIEVQSDTSWTGNVNGGSVDGSGTTSYELTGKTACYVFQKATKAGSLRVKVKKGMGEEPSTTAAYGVVSGCVE
jgi:hypothetical protein